MNPTLTRSSTLLALAALPLAAAEMSVSDLRLSAGMLSNEYKGASSATVTDPNNNTVTTSSSSEDGRNADSNARVQLQYVEGKLGVYGGLIYGAGIAVNQATWDNGQQKAHATTPSVDVLVGYGYAFTPFWHAELTPFAGVGRSYYSVSDNGSVETSKKWDRYYEYGAKVGTYVTLAPGFLVGLEIPYLVGRFAPKYDYTDNGGRQWTVSDKRRNEGFGILLTIGARL